MKYLEIPYYLVNDIGFMCAAWPFD